MAMEADGVAGRIEDRDQTAERRVRVERRGRDRRKPGNRGASKVLYPPDQVTG